MAHLLLLFRCKVHGDCIVFIGLLIHFEYISFTTLHAYLNEYIILLIRIGNRNVHLQHSEYA